MRIHQLTYGMMMGDAISNHVLAIDQRLRDWGFDTAVYAQHVAPEMENRVQSDGRFVPHLANRDDLLIYHYSIYTPNTRLFRAFQGRRVLVYHNITPAHYFVGWDARQASLCDLGRQTLGTLTGADLALGVSEFNRRELVQTGFDATKTAVLPLFLSPQQFQAGKTDAALKNRLQQNAINWLTLGRIVPNKAVEDVIRIFAVYRRHIQPDAHLHVVGSRYLPTYAAALDALVADLGLADCVHFAGRVTDAQLQAYYETAALFVTASHHEGFCVPLLESMAFNVPILARKSSAIPETLGEAGVLFTELGCTTAYAAVAEMAHLMIADESLRQQIIQTQRERLQQLSPARAEMALKEALFKVGLKVDDVKRNA